MLLIISCSAAWAADLEKGLVAYKAGDYATELAEWKPLAEQNNLQVRHYWVRCTPKVEALFKAMSTRIRGLTLR